MLRSYLTYDHVGSLRVIADASGNVVKRIERIFRKINQ
jgi:hypothetical protein